MTAVLLSVLCVIRGAHADESFDTNSITSDDIINYGDAAPLLFNSASVRAKGTAAANQAFVSKSTLRRLQVEGGVHNLRLIALGLLSQKRRSL